MISPPLLRTPRNPERATFGPAVGKVARALGLPLDQWQQEYVDVLLEVDELGRLAYREGRVSIGRQSGKTQMAFAVALDRMLAGERRGWGPRQRLVYAAQNGRAARDKLLDVWVPQLEGSPLNQAVTEVRRSNGDEAITMGSAKLLVLQGGKSAGHGGTRDMALLDECFAHPDNTVEVGARATMLTRSHAQILKMSAAGNTAEESPYWWDAVDDARQRAESGEWGTVCAVEYAAPADADRDDVEAWKLACPALASGRITVDVLKAERDSMDDAQWDRSILNIWGGGAASLFPPTKWAACSAPSLTAKGSGVFASVDVSPGPDGGRTAAIVVAGWAGEHPVLEVIAYGPGTAWVKGKLRELNGRHRFRGVSIDSVGPVRALVDDVRAVMGDHFTNVLGAADVVAAAQQIHQAVLDGTLRHRDDPVLNAAVGAATKRLVGDSWAFRRRDSTADICPLVAASAAYRALMASPREVSVNF